MKQPAIIVADIITDRERALFKGDKERTQFGPFEIVLYWEPHFTGNLGELEPDASFTVDIDGPFGFRQRRHRFRTLAGADQHIEELQDELTVEIGKLAFRIN